MDQNNQPGSGSFMAPVNGMGPELQQLLQSGQGGVLNQNTQSPQAVMPSGAVPPGSPLPPHLGGMPQPSQAINPGGQPAPQQPVPVGPPGGSTPELQIAMNALAQYIKSHSNVLESHHGVAAKNAEAKVIASHAAPAPAQGGE